MNQARRPKRPWSAEEDERLRQLAAQGLSRHAIAVQLDRDDRTVDLRAKALQIELRVRPRAVVVGRASSTVTT
jgi:DNA-binding NarL/FixJ family response regulator